MILPVYCRFSVLCHLVLISSLLWSGAATVGASEESEPNDALGALEFRVAPLQIGSGSLTTKEIDRCRKDLAENGPSASMERDDEFVWMKIMPGVKLHGGLITEEYQAAEYLFVHNWPPSAMSSAAGWGLRSVAKNTTDAMGRPAVQFLFHREGADRFYYLTSANIGQTLAVIVEGKVVSAPNISTAVRSQAIITGDFTSEQIDDIVKTLRKIVRPLPNTAPTPASAPARRAIRTYFIPVLIFVLAVSIVGFFIYR